MGYWWSSLTWYPPSESVQGPRPRGHFPHVPLSHLQLLAPSLGRRGRHFDLLSKQLWDFPLAAREGFSLPDLVLPAACFSRQLPTLPLPPPRLDRMGDFKVPSLRHCQPQEGGSHCKKLTDHRGFITKRTLSSSTAPREETEAQGNKKYIDHTRRLCYRRESESQPKCPAPRLCCLATIQIYI